MKILSARIPVVELLESYGYEPCGSTTIASRWKELTERWTPAVSHECYELIQAMLRSHLECCPDDERWIK